jgi:FkbM family methyltransferase
MKNFYFLSWAFFFVMLKTLTHLKLVVYEKHVFNSVEYIENSNFLIKLNQRNISLDQTFNTKSILNIYDLNKQINNQFDCVKSAHIFVRTTICLHDLKRDVFISQNIKIYGSWEKHLLNIFMNILNSNSKIQVFDIGAHIGIFTLFAAKLGRKVISVEPFYENFIRIQKAAQIENVTNNIILVANGISDKKGHVYKLRKNVKNIGGQGIDDTFNNVNNSLAYKLNNRYYFKSIEMNDLILALPDSFKEAILKIDIENYEIKAFKQAEKLFDRVKFHAIFMEWMGKNRKSRFSENDIGIFLDFMYSRNFKCFNPFGLEELERKLWKFWPGDIIWMTNDLALDLRSI